MTPAPTGGAGPAGLGRQLGPFGVKDLFTVVNLLSGVAAVGFVVSGSPRAAGYAVLVGFLAGDLLDGLVARATGTGNRFGAQFDTVTDHFVHVLVPGLVMYEVYRAGGHPVLGLTALGALVLSASIRHAMFAAAPFDFAPCWCGLPRTVTGFVALSLPLSTVFTRLPAAHLTGTVAVVVLSALGLMPVPYMTHRGERGLPIHVKVLVAVFVTGLPLTFLLARSHTFDLLLAGVLVFAVAGWAPVDAEDRRRFYSEYRRWWTELSRR